MADDVGRWILVREPHEHVRDAVRPYIAIQLEIGFVFTTAGDDIICVLQHELEAQMAITELPLWTFVCDLIRHR